MDYFNLRGEWLYKLPDPYRQINYLPLDAVTLAENLEISYQSALRICKGSRKLKKCELLLLQTIHFGLIHDADFVRKGFYVREGKLITTKMVNYELTTGELFNYAVLRSQVLILQDELKAAHEKIRELTSEPEPTNIIRFSDYKK